ncbi:hypothetical protein G7054_g11351 [Neopestalotiopsis clavispora]|nr:hypothetical protein G7054_g11351 [Neopestalotiopsis clavispora]
MPQYTEEHITQALEAVASGASVKSAALEWGIPRSTLKNRIKGHQARDIAFSDLQRLSPTEENHLAEPWFRHLAIPEIMAIKPTNRYNMDETGILEGRGSNGLVLGSSEARSIRKKQPGSRAWTTLIECISAIGNELPPLVIYKGKSVQQQWFPLDLTPFRSWRFTASENGWTSNPIAVEWLEKVFIPSTQPADPQEARLLILDGHGSHETTEFMYMCFENKIHLIFLPPHASHVLQPLDQSVFGPLKTAYKKELGNVDQWDASTVVGKRNFLICYGKARKAALTKKNIISSWKWTGLWPVSMAKPLMSPLLLENSKTPAKQAGEGHKGLFSKLDIDTPTQRLLFRKVQKGFDGKAYELAVAHRKIEVLQAQVDASRARKRRKVRISPNSKFADIEAIRKTQIEVGEVDDNSDESSDLENPSDLEECIVVASEPR